MKYPPEFIAKIYRAFPNWKALHELVEAGAGEIVGRYLSDNAPTSEAVELARLVINPERTSEAHAAAVKIILKATLWREWLTLESAHKDKQAK